MFACAGASGVAVAEFGDARGFDACVLIERIIAQCVADADMVIEVGEWGDVGECGGVVVDDDGEPESEFAEPDRHRSDIDAEDRVGEDVASDFGDGAGVTQLSAEGGQFLECGDEDAA